MLTGELGRKIRMFFRQKKTKNLYPTMPIVHLLLVTPVPTPVNPSYQDPCPGRVFRTDAGLGHETSVGRWAISSYMNRAGFISAVTAGLVVLGRRSECVWMFSLSRVPFFATPLDCSPPASSVHGIFQARILEQVAISYPRGSSRTKD